MSTNPDHPCRRRGEGEGPTRIQPPATLFARANRFLDATWAAHEQSVCVTAGCGDCGALGFRRMLAALDGRTGDEPLGLAARRGAPADAPGPLAREVAALDFGLLRLAPRWHDALDVALFELRDRGELRFVLDDWLRRDAIPVRVLDLVLFRHARYGYPDERLSDLWIERCLDAAADGGDDGLVESLILACPERVGADPRAYRAAIEAAGRSPCVRAIVRRLGDCA